MIRWMLLFLVGIWILFEGQPVSAQRDTLRKRIDCDKWNYERIMETETEKGFFLYKDKLHQYYLLPQDLPCWFFNPREYSTGPSYSLGISEPGMDSAKASKLAILRAKSLVLLSTGLNIDNISDHFQVVRESDAVFDENSRYLDFSRLSAESVIDLMDFMVNKTLQPIS